MLLGVDDSLQINLVCGDEILKNTKQEKVLGVTLDNKRNFAKHLLNISKNANKKFSALTRVQIYVITDQNKLIFSSFTYCPLIWMFCTKRSLRRINNIHERCLRLIQQNYISEFERPLENTNEKSVHQKCTRNALHERCLRLIQQNYISEFEKPLENTNEKSVHQKCIEFLLIEIYKYLNGLYPDIMNTIFKLRQNTYNLLNFHAFESQNPRTKKFCLESITYRASQLWKNVPEEIRNSASLLIFKQSIKRSL